MSSLIAVINRNTKPFKPWGIYLDAYKTVNREFTLDGGIGSPFGLCALAAIETIAQEAPETAATRYGT